MSHKSISPKLSLIIPVHSDHSRLREIESLIATEQFEKIFGEVLICHNGVVSSVTHEFFQNWISKFSQQSKISFSFYHTDTAGLGAGYKLGLSNAKFEWIVLSASDLPFGLSDVVAFLNTKKDLHQLYVGSKWHDDSIIKYSLLRKVASLIYRGIRNLAFFPLRLPRDTQGTMILSLQQAKQLDYKSCQNDYLFTLQLILRQLRRNQNIIELPISMRFRHDNDSSLNIFFDGIRFILGTINLRIKK